MTEIEIMVNDVIKKEARKEAITILNLASDKDIRFIREVYLNENYNVFCLHLDKIKNDLVKENKLTDDNFGGELF